MSFIKELKGSSTLKVMYNGDYVTIPKYVLSTGRNIVLESLDIDPKSNPVSYPPALEKAAKESFQTYINEYLEASTPAANPGGRHRAERVYDNFPEIMDHNNGFFARNFPKTEGEEALKINPATRGYVLKSGVFKIVDPFLQGTLKMKKASKHDADFNSIKKEDWGTNFVRGSSKTNSIAQVIHNRYLMNIATAWVMCFFKKLVEINGDAMRTKLDSQISGYKYGELTDKENSLAYMADVKAAMMAELSKIDFVSTIPKFHGK